MSRRKPPKRRDARHLAFEQLAARMVLSGGPLDVAMDLPAHELAGFTSQRGGEYIDEYRPAPVAESRMGFASDGPAGLRGDFGPRGDSYGLGYDMFRGAFAPPVVTINPWITTSTVIVIVVEMSAPPRPPVESHVGALSAPPRVEYEGLGGGNIAQQVAANYGGANPGPRNLPIAVNAPSASANALAPLWFGTTAQVSSDLGTGQRFTVLPSWSQGSQSERAHHENESAPRSLLVPSDARDSEGGVIELEHGQTRGRTELEDEPLGTLRDKRKLNGQALAALERVWSDLGRALQSVNKSLGDAQAAKRDLPAPPQVAEAAPQQTPSPEGGMIELAVDRAILAAVQPIPLSPAGIAEAELTVEAGVAMFQAFDLGNVPGADEGSAPAIAPAASAAPQERAAADDSGELSNQRAALSAAAVLTALPFSLRKRTEDVAKQGRLARALRWLDKFRSR